MNILKTIGNTPLVKLCFEQANLQAVICVLTLNTLNVQH